MLQREDALGELYRRHGASVAAVTRMILGNSPGCDDVVAEVFAALWLSPQSFDPTRGSLLNFLRMKARGRSIDVLRSDTSRRRREDNDLYSGRAPALDIESSVLASETASELRRAVASLPPAEAEVIHLAYFRGMSYIAVARHLGVAEGTVKSRIRKGLRRLGTTLRVEPDPQANQSLSQAGPA